MLDPFFSLLPPPPPGMSFESGFERVVGLNPISPKSGFISLGADFFLLSGRRAF